MEVDEDPRACTLTGPFLFLSEEKNMAATVVKIEANRANAQHSTGPRTEAGKQTSSRNAEKHNLTGGTAFVEGEDRQAYEAHCQKQVYQHQPAAEHEIFLVQEMADAMWRLKRARRMESELLEQSLNPYLDDDEKIAIQLQRLTRYISAIERTYYRAYNQIKKITQERNRPALAKQSRPPYTFQEIRAEAGTKGSRQNEPTLRQLADIEVMMHELRMSKMQRPDFTKQNAKRSQS